MLKSIELLDASYPVGAFSVRDVTVATDVKKMRKASPDREINTKQSRRSAATTASLIAAIV